MQMIPNSQIPGVTVPLGHLPVIVIAVFLSQVVHELGHAIAGARYEHFIYQNSLVVSHSFLLRESLSMTSVGLSFAICIPSAFVSFPATGLNSLAARARCRVISAGPFHNLAFWFLLLLVSLITPIKLASLFSGYKNVSDIGKVVINVNNVRFYCFYRLHPFQDFKTCTRTLHYHFIFHQVQSSHV